METVGRKRPNAKPSGGGGGAWAEMNEKMEASRAKQTASLRGGLTHGTNMHPYDNPTSAAGVSGTSIFDPVLAELAYRWFCPPGGRILDPFAGGSVRAVVAARLERAYHGIELREEQIEANEEQRALCRGGDVVWQHGDSRKVLKTLPKGSYDFIFTCPPYADLEVYSEDERDLSQMEWEAFCAAYEDIIASACACLRKDRFAAIVVGDVRAKDGGYLSLPWRTIQNFENCGLRLYNQAVLVTACGSLALRVAKMFNASRKIGTTHQHFFVFCKGDPRKATAAIGEVEFGDIDEAAAEMDPGELYDELIEGGEV